MCIYIYIYTHVHIPVITYRVMLYHTTYVASWAFVEA